MHESASTRETNHEFLSSLKWPSIRMPWESDCVKPIFQPDVIPSNDLKQDASWSSVLEMAHSEDGPTGSSRQLETVSEKPVFVSCIRAMHEKPFKEMK